MVNVGGVNYVPALKLSMNSSTDYSAAVTNVGVVMSADHEITRAGAGEEAFGVMVNKPAEDEQAEIIVLGSAPMKVGDTITIGQMVKCDALGEAVPIASDKDWAIGKALAAGVDGDEIEVLLMPGHVGV